MDQQDQTQTQQQPLLRQRQNQPAPAGPPNLVQILISGTTNIFDSQTLASNANDNNISI
ncbi:10238_t:CDS:2 [Ambispora leptoticha]|uniref:10238_t:CDS:1 n=1 Tax=Ambispora leptoticha TaxID=144679 RepID=A0A9N9GWK0_9GLOM|nr:10238_t:CDS:2 [Ambispora leptoticha]